MTPAGGKRPAKFSLSPDGVALLIIDIQERLVPVMNEKDSVINNCLHLIELSRMMGIPMIVTEQYPKGLGLTVERIRNALPVYKPVEKITFNCCEEPSFMKMVGGLTGKNLVLAGMETHICVLQTCVGLLDAGFNIHIAGDAVCSRVRQNRETAIEFMRDAGAVISCTETILFQLLREAGTNQFKAISKRIK